MKYQTQDIADLLREAREAKQLSQRELSRLAGVPQAQISRIEANSVDLRLSSLVALASALDLEIALIPRKAMPAVKSITRQTTERAPFQVPSIGKEMQQLQRAIRAVQIDAPTLPQLEEVRKIFGSIQRRQIDPRYLDNLRSARTAIERATAAEYWSGLSDASKALKVLRNEIAHLKPTEQHRSSRPAYSLDEEDDDA